MSIREEVALYIQNLSNTDNIDHSVNLFENGYLSSLDALSLFSFIEDNYKISIDDDDLGVENFGSIESIVNYLEKTSAN